MLEFLQPVEHFGRKFDRGCILFEFSAFREPERTRFPQIGAFLRAKGVEFNDVPTPKMLWRGKLWPDLYIANQLDALRGDEYDFPSVDRAPPLYVKRKEDWDGDVSLERLSRSYHGETFHAEFIEPMCRKITGRTSAEIAAKHHRAIWLPLYWPQTLRARQNLPTPFYYPRSGCAGIAREFLRTEESRAISSVQHAVEFETTAISIAYAVGTPLQFFSVLFVVDESPIYRITDMDVCAGISPRTHRMIVEYRGECDVWEELFRLGVLLPDEDSGAFLQYSAPINFPLPTLANVARGWKPKPTLNDQFWSLMHDA